MSIPTNQDERPVEGRQASLPVTVLNTSVPVQQSGEWLVVPGRSDQLDVFGRARSAEPRMTFAWSAPYGLDPLTWQTMSSGAGNGATWSANTRAITLALAGNAGYAIRQTYRYTPYQPGRSQQIQMTGVMGNPVSGAIKRIGQFDASNGLFWQQGADGTLAVVRRSSTSGSIIDTVVPRASWNIDRFDGTGPSGVVLDLTKDQVWTIEYGWLGIATARWGLYLNGQTYYCHQEYYANIEPISYMQSATLPLRYEISAAGAGVTASMVQICTSINSEGGYFDAPSYVYSAGRDITAAISTASEAPIVALRPLTTFGTVPNRTSIRIIGFDALAISAPLRCRMLYFPPGSANPITGGAWAQPNAESAVEVNVSATAVNVAGSYEIGRALIGSSTGATSRFAASTRIVQTFPVTIDAAGAGNPLTSSAGANPAYVVLTGLGASATAAGGLEWEEIR